MSFENVFKYDKNNIYATIFGNFECDDGKLIDVEYRNPKKALSSNTKYKLHYNCHGFTFTGGEYWINSDQVEKILNGESYSEITNDKYFSLADIAVFFVNNTIVHSAKIYKRQSIGLKTESILFVSKNGINELKTYSYKEIQHIYSSNSITPNIII